jgi:hypothetical protein
VNFSSVSYLLLYNCDLYDVRLKLDQTVDSTTHELNQGCGLNWTCDSYVQAPMCDPEDQDASPYESFRVYSYHELSRDTGSTMDVNAELVDPTVQDMRLVNGQYQPVIQDLKASVPVILRVVAALGGGLVTITPPQNCSMTIIAYDGVYLRAGLATAAVMLVEGGRADVQVVCTSPGRHDLQTSDGTVLLTLNVTTLQSQSGSSQGVNVTVTDQDLADITRPSYLEDLQGLTTSVDSRYSVAFWQNTFNNSKCGTFIQIKDN